MSRLRVVLAGVIIGAGMLSAIVVSQLGHDEWPFEYADFRLGA